jgi:hypothetical protein
MQIDRNAWVRPEIKDAARQLLGVKPYSKNHPHFDRAEFGSKCEAEYGRSVFAVAVIQVRQESK